MLQQTNAASSTASTSPIVNNNKANHNTCNYSNHTRINQPNQTTSNYGGGSHNFGNVQFSNNGISETTIANAKQPYVHHFRIAKKKTTIEFKMVDANDIRKNMYGNTMQHHGSGRTTTSTSSQLNIASSQTNLLPTTNTNSFNNQNNTGTTLNSNVANHSTTTTSKSPQPPSTTNHDSTVSSSSSNATQTNSNNSHHTQSSVLSTIDNTVSSDQKHTKKQKPAPASFAISSKITKHHSGSRRNSMLSSHSVDLLQNNSNFQQEVLHCTPTTLNCTSITTKKNHQTRRKSVASPSSGLLVPSHADQPTIPNLANNNAWNATTSSPITLPNHHSATTPTEHQCTYTPTQPPFSTTNTSHRSNGTSNHLSSNSANVSSCPPTSQTPPSSSYFVAGFTFGSPSKTSGDSLMMNSSNYHHHTNSTNGHSDLNYHGLQDGLYGEAYYSTLTPEQRRYLTHGGRKTFATLPSIEEMTRYHELRRNSIDELTQNFAQCVSTAERVNQHHEDIPEPSPILDAEHLKNPDQRFRRRQTYAFESDHFSPYDAQYDSNCLQSLKSFNFPSRNPQHSHDTSLRTTNNNSTEYLPTHQHSLSLNNVPSSTEHGLLPSIHEIISKR
ncbi:hypothetical protein C9374_006680 [Naegleria lovaniensis]|uniref:Uncharacterized protein n=1 Tax=Naegleria lovaniensis TaxID=51637 RepID=A0AA88GJ75_NAELO|nr:uncharacterized protein C9374_006680 [Naegleria lovaniensis]KAG2379563.1 hypothetical protein C9374_006680 [Naegleria lovaniensis]